MLLFEGLTRSDVAFTFSRLYLSSYLPACLYMSACLDIFIYLTSIYLPILASLHKSLRKL